MPGRQTGPFVAFGGVGVAFVVMREGGSNSHAECRQEHQWRNQESAYTFSTRESGLRSPASERYAADAGELRLGRAVVNHQQRRQQWLEAHFSGCSAFQSRSFFCSGSSGTKPCRVRREPHKGDKRYVRRKRGKFTKSQDNVGRSLATDRRQHVKRVVKSGEGDRGDRQPQKWTLAEALARLF
jgi:hypothetical protein